EDVRTTPGGVEAEDAVGGRRIEFYVEVEHVQHVEINRKHVVDLMTRIEVDVPLRRLLAVHGRHSVRVNLRGTKGHTAVTIARCSAEVDRLRAITVRVVGGQRQCGVLEDVYRVLPCCAPLRSTRA